MSNFIANARIAVYADTTKFSAALKTVLTTAERTKIVVKLVPDPKGFIRDATIQIKSIEKKLPPVKVKVVPNTVGFATAVRLATADAVKNIKIPVGVVPGQVAAVGRGGAASRAAAGGVAAGGVVDKRMAQAQLAVNAAVDAGVAARRRLDAELTVAEKRVIRLAREEIHLAAADEAVKKAVLSGNAALVKRAEEQQRVASTAVTRTKGQVAKDVAAAQAADPAFVKKQADEAAAARIAASEKAASAERQMVKTHIEALNADKKRTQEAAEAFRSSQLKRVQSINDELAALDKRSRALQTGIAATRTRTRDILGQPIIGGGAEIGERAIKQNEALAISEDAAARSATQAAAARRHSAVAAIAEADPVKKLASAKAAERAATAAVVEAKEAETAARFAAQGAQSAELRNIAALRAQELGLAEARLADASAATAQAKAQLASAGRFGAARRALEATGAQLVGLRGAALSATGAFIATAAGAIALTKAVQSASQLESTLNVFKVTAGASADEMERVSSTARELGRDVRLPGVTAQSAADALTQLSKAGLSVQDSIDGARGVLQLATAAAIDNEQATLLAASALNAFGLAGDQAVRVADVLANAANASQGSIVDMGVALQQASAVARQAGLSLEQTVGVLTLFARAGLRGSDAGTSFRTALIRLINPTTKARKEIEALGLHLRTSTGAINLNVFDEFAQKTRNLTAAQRDQALAIIFGQDAIRGAAILAREGTRGLDTQIAALGKAGTAADLAAARNAGFAGSLENLKNQITDAGITIGQVLIPPLKLVVDQMAGMIQNANNVASSFVEVIKKTNEMAVSFSNAAIKAGDLGKGILRSAEDAKNADWGPGPPDWVQKLLGFAGIPGGDLPVRVAKFGGQQAKQQVSQPPIPIKFPISIDSTDAKTSVEDARKQIKAMVGDLKRLGGATRFNETVIGLRKLSAQLKNGDDNAKKLSTDLDIFITKLQQASAEPKTDLFFPPDLGKELAVALTEVTSGEPGRLAAEAVVDKFVSTLGVQQTRSGRALFDALFGGFQEGLALFVSPLVQQAAAAGAAVKQAFLDASRVTGAEVSRLTNDLAAATSAALDVQIEGGTPLEQQKKLLAIAKQSEAAARRLVRVRALRVQDVLLSPGTTKAQLAKRRKELDEAKRLVKEAIDAQKTAQGEITSIQEKAKTDAENKKTKAQKARDDADQAFLDSLAPGEAKLDLRAAKAAGSENLNLQLQVLVDRRKLLRRQIALISDNLNDRKQAAKLIAAKKIEIENVTNDINNKLDEINQLAITGSPVFEAQVNLAEAEGNIPQQIKFINIRIEKINALIKAHKAEGAALNKLKTERANLENKREDLQNQQLSEKTALAQSIFDLTGNRNPLLRAINAQIAETQADIRAAKAAGRSTTVLQTELNNFLKQRKELLGDLQDQTKGLTVFELLKQNVETFNEFGGNLIQGNQPFPGPTGFTADVAQWLVAQKSSPTTNLTPSAAGKTKIEINDDRLVRGLNRLADVIEKGSGNNPAGTPKVSVVGQRWTAIGAFWESRRTQNYLESIDG